MPELPEVENVARQLGALAGATVEQAQTSGLPLRYQIDSRQLHELEGKRFGEDGPQRVGRYILAPLGSNQWLMAHLGMTGSLRLESQDRPRKHDHLRLDLRLPNGSRQSLIYNDPRRFGGMSLLEAASLNDLRKHLKLGLEPTAPIDPEALAELYHGSRAIKPMLMDNALVTGVGNIYASEVCHQARIHPARSGSSLSPSDLQELSRALNQVIARAIEQGGSTFRNYAHVDGGKGSAQQFHCVYGREDQPCPRCGAAVKSFKQSGRATFFCPACQV